MAAHHLRQQSAVMRPDPRSRRTASTSGQSATEWPCGSEDMPRSCVIDHQVGNPDHQQRRPEPAQALGPEPARGAIRMEDWEFVSYMLIDTDHRSDHGVEQQHRESIWAPATVLDEHFELGFSSRLNVGNMLGDHLKFSAVWIPGAVAGSLSTISIVPVQSPI
jgi:hypothetical protein